MGKTYQDLGVYSDLVAAAKKSHAWLPLAKPGKATQKAVREMLSFQPGPDKPRQVKVEAAWKADGVEGQTLSWSVGYGPRTQAWLLKPAGAKGRLPGIVGLHDHGGFKYYGKEKIAIGPQPLSELERNWHIKAYGGRAFANEIARQGYVVLVHDCFTWGSRRFPLQDITEWDRSSGEAMHRMSPSEPWPGVKVPDDISRYVWAAVYHEHTVQKYCAVLGTSLAGVMAYEDRVAAEYLASRSDVLPGGVGCVGLSGGGLRSTLLQATCDRIRAAVVVGLMSTYDGLLDHNVVTHTWMLYPCPTWARQGDWPDLVACRAPSPLMVQFDNEDALFTLAGMKAAAKRIAGHYKAVGKPGHFEARFFPGPHKFDVPMQDVAIAFFRKHLGA